MCIGINALAVKGDDRVYRDEVNSGHGDLIEERGLRDDDLFHRSFVRLEARPLGSLTSLDVKDWEIAVEEDGTLPAWFEEERDIWKDRLMGDVLDIVKGIIRTGRFDGSLELGGTQVKDLGQLSQLAGIWI